MTRSRPRKNEIRPEAVATVEEKSRDATDDSDSDRDQDALAQGGR
jgi:hypothetical protein